MLANAVLLTTLLGAFAGAAMMLLYRQAARTSEVGRVVVDIRPLAEDVVALNGVDRRRFLEPGAQKLQRDLEDLVGGVNDGKLAANCRRVLEAYKLLFAASPPQRAPFVVIGSPSPPTRAEVEEDRRRFEQCTRQVAHAEECLEAIQSTLARINTLERRLLRRP